MSSWPTASLCGVNQLSTQVLAIKYITFGLLLVLFGYGQMPSSDDWMKNNPTGKIQLSSAETRWCTLVLSLFFIHEFVCVLTRATVPKLCELFFPVRVQSHFLGYYIEPSLIEWGSMKSTVSRCHCDMAKTYDDTLTVRLIGSLGPIIVIVSPPSWWSMVMFPGGLSGRLRGLQSACNWYVAPAIM